MTKKSTASASTPFRTSAPPPVPTMTHIGRKSLTVTWPHVYGVSEFLDGYRVTLTPGPTIFVGPVRNEGDLKAYTFTGLAMDYPYTVSVQAVNLPVLLPPPGKPEAVGPPGSLNVRTLPEWGEPPATGIDGWNGVQFVAGRTNFHYRASGIFMDVNEWAKAQIGNILTPDGGSVDYQPGMSWIEFNTDRAPELMITAVLMKAGHRWPQ